MEAMTWPVWAALGAFFVKTMLEIFGTVIKKKWHNCFVVDRKIILIDKNPATRDYAALQGPDGKWGPVEFVSRSWWRDKIVFYHIDVIDGVAEFSRRVVDYDQFSKMSKRELSKEAKARLLKAIPENMKGNKEITKACQGK